MAAAIFQLGKGRDACACELWLIGATADITLVVSHTPGEFLTLSADALSWYHTGNFFEEIVHCMIDNGVTIISPARHPFQLSDEL